jgi:putative redox protein
VSDSASLMLTTVEGEGLRFKVHVGRFMLALDSGAHAQAASPVQVILAAIGGCTGMDVIGILRKKRQKVTAYTIEVVGERAAEHPKVYTKVTVVHRLTGHALSPTAVEDAIRLSDTKYCSVFAMLKATVEITSRFEILPADG